MSFCPWLSASFHLANLLYTRGVSSAFKVSREPRAHDLRNVGGRCGASADRKHVRIVVLSREPRRLFSPGNCRAHAGNFVRSDRHARARTADEQALLNSSVRHLLGHLPRIIRIVDRLFRHGAEIVKLNAEFPEQLLQALLLGVTSVIAGECNSHLENLRRVEFKEARW